jgi:hypothetical protein
MRHNTAQVPACCVRDDGWWTGERVPTMAKKQRWIFAGAGRECPERAAGCGAVSGTDGAGQRVDRLLAAPDRADELGTTVVGWAISGRQRGRMRGFRSGNRRRLSRGCDGLACPTPFVWHREQHYVIIEPGGRSWRRHPCVACPAAPMQEQGATHRSVRPVSQRVLQLCSRSARRHTIYASLWSPPSLLHASSPTAPWFDFRFTCAGACRHRLSVSTSPRRSSCDKFARVPKNPSWAGWTLWPWMG